MTTLDELTKLCADTGIFVIRSGDNRFEIGAPYGSKWSSGPHYLEFHGGAERIAEITAIVRNGLTKCGPDCKVCGP